VKQWQKQELREEIRRRKLEHTADESSAVIEHLLSEPHFARAQTILLYSALKDEVPTRQLLDRLVSEGRTILLPKVISATAMELRLYSKPAELQQGAFGIMEPTGEQFTDYAQIDVAVIPGMAFDREGHRLGRGRGYYDRFLSRVPFNIYKIGLCFPWQMVDSVPCESTDIIMDCVVSV